MLPNQPLAERLRPRDLDEFCGQEHLVGKNSVLRKLIESGNIPSFIFEDFNVCFINLPGLFFTFSKRVIVSKLLISSMRLCLIRSNFFLYSDSMRNLEYDSLEEKS